MIGSIREGAKNDKTCTHYDLGITIMINSVGVIGAGTMGHGIAEACAIAGLEVCLVDVSDDFLATARQKINWSLESLLKKNIIKESVESITSRITTSTNLSDLSGVDYVIEAVKEDSEVKSRLLKDLSGVLKPGCILSTNTSTIPISELASESDRPELFIGLHFSNPPVMMPLVEIIMGSSTRESALNETKNLVKRLRKDFVVVMKDVEGFLINRINDRVITEALAMHEEGATIESLDSMARFRLNFPMGIFELLDFVGIDVVFNANSELKKRGFDTSSSKLLGKMVKSGKLGTKTGNGFYSYPGGSSYSRHMIIPGAEMYSVSPLRLVSTAINEAAWILENEVASLEDIEKSMVMAMNWPEGPLTMADRFGIRNVVEMLRQRQSATGLSRYEPNHLLLEMVEGEKLGLESGTGFKYWKVERTRFGSVIYRKQHTLALVTLDRPEKLNALDEDEWEGLRLALEHAMADSSVRCVIINGNGRAFCAGDDIEMMKGWRSKRDVDQWIKNYSTPLLDLLAKYQKPIISAVNGFAFGGGCELNMMFDIVVAAEDAIFSLPEGLIGALPPIGTTLGTALVSRKLTRYALTGEWIPARDAMEIGIVDVVVPGDQLLTVASEFAEKISKMAPLSIKEIKSAVNSVRSVFSSQVALGTDKLAGLASTRDFAEGQDAFVHKRKPTWTGN